jgi:hypothetical protein
MFPNPLVVAAAALAASSYPAVGGDVEVVENTGRSGLGDWLSRNNRHRFPKGKRAKPIQPKRLQRATGPGSINERNEMFALIEAGKPQEAAEYYRRCLNINYRAGKPKLHRDMVTWYAYYN